MKLFFRFAHFAFHEVDNFLRLGHSIVLRRRPNDDV